MFRNIGGADGSKFFSLKLEQRIELARRYKAGETPKVLAEAYGISRRHVTRLAKEEQGEGLAVRDPFAHVRHTTGQINPNPRSRTNHAASIARIIAVSASGPIVLSKCKLRPPPKRNSTVTDGDVSATGDCAAGTTAVTGMSH
mgnify:CR=1 FL=1|jgi:hypothetical protein|tara:strand:+ start:6672 stop:7100 length:429 start_codon:yes stop_codon:yes gene_type:complete